MKKNSKFITMVLRHKAHQFGINLTKDGYAKVEDILNLTNITFEELCEIVDTNDKKRLSFNDDKTLIRANQGHTIKNVHIAMDEYIPSGILYHGTKRQYIESIKKTGLNKGNRQHVHLSLKICSAQQVADRRHGDSIILKINARHMHADGIKFYISENGVILTDFVDSKYIMWE